MFDICIIGSGAGAGPIAYELTLAGAKVLILEKGDFYKEEDFSKDEIAFCRRSIITPKLKDEYHLIEEKQDDAWVATPTYASGWDFWNGNLVGGSSNLMSGFFHRLHPKDFKLKSAFGEIKGANIVDWPISYEDMEPFYEKTERVVGISGEVTPFKYLEPRSTKDFPFPPTQEHPISKHIDKAAKKEGVVAVKTPRAIMSVAKGDRNSCYYSNYCGSYGCSSGAKGSARAALLQPALKSGNLEIRVKCFVKKLHIDEKDKINEVEYIDENGKSQRVKATTFVLAAQAIESCRLLLNSKSQLFPKGVANNNGQVGKNLLFSAGGVVSGHFDESIIPLEKLMTEGLFVNRTIKDWYFMDGVKGGISEALFEHANPIVKANKQKWQSEGLIWGEKLYDKIYEKFHKSKMLTFEIFNDWLPNDDCFVSVDEGYHDKFGTAVAKIRIGAHPENIKVGKKIAKKTRKILETMGAKDISEGITPYPPQNLQAGGCRFGDDPKTSVLNKECRAHEVKNLFVTDGSFMPTGGSVPYTWTIYANSFRVAEVLKKEFYLAKKS